MDKKINPIPDFTTAKPGSKCWHPRYGTLKISYVMEHPFHEEWRIGIKHREMNMVTSDSEDYMSFNNKGYEYSSGALKPSKYPTLFKSKEQFLAFWEAQGEE